MIKWFWNILIIWYIKYFYILKLHKFKKSPKNFLSHSILITKYGDLNLKHPIHYLNEVKEIIYEFQHKENVIK